MKLLRRIWWIIRYWLTRRPVPCRTIHIEELPTTLRPNCIYVVGENGYQWFAAMICPCGCGEVLHMNLLQQSRPSWSVLKHDDGTVSLSPSVWRKKGCRSHFFLRRGVVDWCHARQPIAEDRY